MEDGTLAIFPSAADTGWELFSLLYGTSADWLRGTAADVGSWSAEGTPVSVPFLNAFAPEIHLFFYVEI